jgi:hypothetical protein
MPYIHSYLELRTIALGRRRIKDRPLQRCPGGAPPFSSRLGPVPNSAASGGGWRRDDIHTGPPGPTSCALPCYSKAHRRPWIPMSTHLHEPPVAHDVAARGFVGGAGAASGRRREDVAGAAGRRGGGRAGAPAVGAKAEQEKPRSPARASCSSGSQGCARDRGWRPPPRHPWISVESWPSGEGEQGRCTDEPGCGCHTRFYKENRMHIICAPGSFTHT